MPVPDGSPGDVGDVGDDPDARAHAIAEKTLRRLRELNEQFPSRDLAEAIKKLERWREEHLKD